MSPPSGRGGQGVCPPRTGGSATFYQPVSAGLSADTDVLAVQYPGRRDRRAEPCVATIADRAAVPAGTG
ncbi:thioesterase domain-containing protein [Streptomyces sp. NPDC005752]|uniref:thioesterase domain-containing protein n=1 Tax=Streptomyces sp. NPDC005752 TaxID=3157065 RepID=UPI0033C795EE